MRRRRRIAVLTGTRAEYGLLRSLLRAIVADRRLELQLIVTGTHLLRAFGATAHEIRRDGFSIAARVRLQTGSDDPHDEAEGVGRAVAGLARALRRLDSDIVVVLGDRVEAMAGALAAVCCRRFVAHIHGGDVAPGDIDDSLRHAITKLSHVHFPATRQSARRIERLGEETSRIHVTGSLAVDEIRNLGAPDAAWVRGRLGVPDGADYALVVQHPIGDAPGIERRRMADTLAAVGDGGLWPVVIHPNSDPGYSGIVRAIEVAQRAGRISAFRSFPRTEYLQALLRARVLVGNSSSGIIEASAARTPVVNIGPRQAGRQRGGSSVIACSYGRPAITRTLARVLQGGTRFVNVYGDGRAGPRIAKILAELPLTSAMRCKRIVY